MPERILIDELHLSFRVPSGLPESQYLAIRRTLQRKRFLTEFDQAVRSVLRQKPSLRNVVVAISR